MRPTTCYSWPGSIAYVAPNSLLAPPPQTHGGGSSGGKRLNGNKPSSPRVRAGGRFQNVQSLQSPALMVSAGLTFPLFDIIYDSPLDLVAGEQGQDACAFTKDEFVGITSIG